MIRVFVVDTNVLVSALWNSRGACGRLVDALVAGRFLLAYTTATLGEYRDVLSRPSLGLSESLADNLVATVEQNGVFVHPAPVAAVLLPDPDDARFLAAALRTPDRILVTGNPRHFPKKLCAGVKVISAREALTMIASE